MKSRKTVFALVILLMGTLVAESAFARHRGGPRISFGIGFGVPFYSYPYYAPYAYYPYYPRYYPAPYVVERPPVYIERQPAAPAPAPAPQSQAPAVQQPQALANNYWYYCQEAGAYYPHVQECAGGWQRVLAQP